MADMARRKTTVYVDDDVLRAARIRAARLGKRDSDIVEEALRAYLGFDAIRLVWSRSDLSEEEALSLANEEVHASRPPRPHAR
jgi:Arc/MetJ family transcription regulator